MSSITSSGSRTPTGTTAGSAPSSKGRHGSATAQRRSSRPPRNSMMGCRAVRVRITGRLQRGSAPMGRSRKRWSSAGKHEQKQVGSTDSRSASLRMAIRSLRSLSLLSTVSRIDRHLSDARRMRLGTRRRAAHHHMIAEISKFIRRVFSPRRVYGADIYLLRTNSPKLLLIMRFSAITRKVRLSMAL